MKLQEMYKNTESQIVYQLVFVQEIICQGREFGVMIPSTKIGIICLEIPLLMATVYINAT